MGEEAVKLIRARFIRLLWDGNKICALVGDDLQSGVAGFGDDVSEALLDLVNKIRVEQITVWVSRPAKQFRENGITKCICPECGHVSEMGGLDEVIAYVCDECGSGVDVEPFAETKE